MIDLKAVEQLLQEDVEAAISWCDDKYTQVFSEHFKRQRDLYKRLESKTHPITDEELEDILTTLPLEMFTVAEKLSKLKTAQEVIKVRNKRDLAEKKESSTLKTQTARDEDAKLQMLEQQLMDTLYTAVIERVDKEMSFTRELIMGAKKVWDRRSQAEGASPIAPINPEVPTVTGNKTFYEQTQAARKQPVYGV